MVSTTSFNEPSLISPLRRTLTQEIRDSSAVRQSAGLRSLIKTTVDTFDAVAFDMTAPVLDIRSALHPVSLALVSTEWAYERTFIKEVVETIAKALVDNPDEVR